MIKMVADNAHAAGKWVGICGELGADMELTKELLQIGGSLNGTFRSNLYKESVYESVVVKNKNRKSVLEN